MPGAMEIESPNDSHFLERNQNDERTRQLCMTWPEWFLGNTLRVT